MKTIFSKASLVFIVLTALLLVLSGACGYMFMQFRKARGQAAQSESLLEKMRQEQTRLGDEKKKLEKDNQKLQADVVSYLGVNTKLQDDKDAAVKQLEEVRQLLTRKEGEVQRAKQELEELAKSAREAKEAGKVSVQAPSQEELRKKLEGLEATLRKERALFHYNLGVAYARAKLYKEAEAAYEKSLEYDPVNADAHYNLGLMYDNYEYDPYRAKAHFTKYLELKPHALDKDEVEGWMRALNDRIE